TMTLTERMSHHNELNDNTKMGKYIKCNRENLEISLIKEVKVMTRIELLLYEDYYIYKLKSIENGLNTNYNTEIVKMIMSESQEDKWELLRQKISENSINEMNYNENKQNPPLREYVKSLRDIKLDLSEKNWKDDDGIKIYNPLKIIVNKETTYEDPNILKEIYITYLMCWENGDYKIIQRQGGLQNISKGLDMIHRDILIEMIMKNGAMKIFPISYIKSENKLKIIQY